MPEINGNQEQQEANCQRREQLEEALVKRAEIQSEIPVFDMEHDTHRKRFHSLEQGLYQRCDEQSRLTWLEVRITNQLQVRAQAKDWLKRNRWSVFTGLVNLPISMFPVSRILSLAGSAIAGAAAGYFIATALPVADLALPCAVTAAALAAVGSQWQSLREFYY